MDANNLELWTNLYEACKDLRKLNPWEFYSSEDIVIIKNPVTNV